MGNMKSKKRTYHLRERNTPGVAPERAWFLTIYEEGTDNRYHTATTESYFKRLFREYGLKNCEHVDLR